MKKFQLPSPVRVRPATEADVPFIFSSWLKSYRGGRFAQDMHTTIYYTEHHKIVENLLKTCEVLVACNDVDAAEIYGFLCHEKIDGHFTIHYIYTKQTYRMLGIGNILMNAANHDSSIASFYSHNTVSALKLAAKYRCIYNPYLALSCEYRKPLPEKSKTEYVPEDAFVEKPEDIK